MLFNFAPALVDIATVTMAIVAAVKYVVFSFQKA